ncbi:MAG: ATP-dependent Clp protease ATP-binding subunit [Puniceicoccales bacterium]|jgi:ATP-dependent Clp protease ATP-binding subunit ClpC|nr:ATP-dependent Clp protease ATP-binding subunit [Puniceicoccales bacterium]
MEAMHRFSPRVQKVLNGAREEAIRMQHGIVRSEHLLLALLKLPESTALDILGAFGVGADQVREALLKQIWGGRGRHGVELSTDGGGGNQSAMEIAPDARAVVLLAAAESHAFGHEFIGTEHLLVGFLRESEGVAGKVLRGLGLEASACREEIPELVGDDDDDGNAPSYFKGHAAATEEIGAARQLDAISTFASNLTESARSGKLDLIIGRKGETERCMQILCRRTKNNPVLLGDAGVGKTAIVEGLAQAIVIGDVPEVLQGKQIYALDLPLMVAGTKFRGQFEERLKAVMGELQERKEIILFLDELHTIVGAGNGDGSMDAANILKPALSRGELQCIGATTFAEYRKFIEKDPALERRFQPVHVDEPDCDGAIAILRGIKEKYEEHHGISYGAGTLEAAVRLSDKYIGDRQLPDKAIDIVDEAGAMVRLRELELPPQLTGLRKKRDLCRKKKLEAAACQQFELAAHMRDEERRLGGLYEAKFAKWKGERGLHLSSVSVDDVRLVVSRLAKIPIDFLCKSNWQRLANLKEKLRETVIGQDGAIDSLDRAIRRSQAQVHDPSRPIGSFLFLGPTGVGKTLLAKELARFLFGNGESIIRVDMSEYMEKFSATRLVGSPPGYVGHGEGGQLTERIRRKPHSVVLFDEIEKAHPEMMQLLLQVLEDGKLTDSQGRAVSFRNAIIIMTSNVGAELFIKNSTVGFAGGGHSFDGIKEKALEELRRTFRPEFLNRFTDVIVFKPLCGDEMERILCIELDKLRRRIGERGCTLAVSDGAKKLLMEEGFDGKHGARGLRRTLERKLEDLLAERLLCAEGSGRFSVDVCDGAIAIAFSKRKAPTAKLQMAVSQKA